MKREQDQGARRTKKGEFYVPGLKIFPYLREFGREFNVV
jgi:hypothetical protein